MIFGVEKLNPFTDSRGIFVKLMEDGNYPKNYEIKNKTFRPIQCFFTVTRKSAIRGMHFYKSSSENKKIISRPSRGIFSKNKKRGGVSKSFVVISGQIFIAAVDLRSYSKSFGTIETLIVGAHTQVFVPRMVATGFQVISNEATLLYFLDSVHQPDEDFSINPNSCGINWPLPLGEISNRDFNAMTLEEYYRIYK